MESQTRNHVLEKMTAWNNRHVAETLVQELHEPGLPFLHISGGIWSDDPDEFIDEAFIQVSMRPDYLYINVDTNFLMFYARSNGNIVWEFILGNDGGTEYGWDQLDEAMDATRQWLREHAPFVKYPYGIRNALNLKNA